MSNKKTVPRIRKELSNLKELSKNYQTFKKPNNPFRKQAKDTHRHFMKGNIEKTNKQIMLNIIIHQRNAN